MNLFGDEPECNQIIDLMKQIGTTNATLTTNNQYQYPTLFGPRFRTSTFIGMLYDLRNNMKLNIDHDTYKVWVNGNADEIFHTFGKLQQPLDWHLSRNKHWCQTIQTQVVDMDDLSQLGFNVPTINPDVAIPDWGNFITDHTPLISTIEFTPQ